MKYLHVYAQVDHPDFVSIRGTREALETLAAAIQTALNAPEITQVESSGFMDANDETFDIVIEVNTAEEIKTWRVPSIR